MLKREVGAVMAAVFSATTDLAGEPQRGPERANLYEPGSAMQATPLRVEVLDGTRFRDTETNAVYRLYGIATCLPGQVAHLGRQPWPCGTTATAWLVAATLGKWLSCATLRDEAGERLARCASADHPDLAGAMVRDGVAVTLPPTEHDPSVRAYVSAERDARKAYRGLWASSFEMPWEYRARLAHSENRAPRAGASQ
ncbi:thermonuclease family protein [Lichenifustis flavocetrariae]|uniref:Thermonuclease family protein n=1 Tax=Lichenifustis flavocetrariae TaxID=2949735 RepID=A0AA42CMG5_9HYPH|nr:thermonuclease family protein [Lichenifustis flavocetrariae]MCW6512528.1 thermonuclease family protein [Lichenifustis flavocetrariae]